MAEYPTPLVSADWLSKHLHDPDVVALDSTYFLPNVGRDALTEFGEARIPGARFFDFDGTIKDPDHSQPHMLPSPALFGEAVGKLGIDNSSFIVAYDQLGMFSVARCWWMFRVFGHDRVAVLDGGMPAWKAAGHATEAGASPDVLEKSFTAGFRPELVSSAEDVLASIGKARILDARARERYTGEAPEPRPGLRSGHIPQSKSLPFQSLTGEGGLMKTPDAVRQHLTDEGIEPQGQVIASCGSGVTACVLALGLFMTGQENVSVYDGSWSEWGARDDLPIET